MHKTMITPLSMIKNDKDDKILTISRAHAETFDFLLLNTSRLFKYFINLILVFAKF